MPRRGWQGPALPDHQPPWMSAQEWRTITMRADGATYRAIAEAIGVRWPERVRQIEAKAWRKLAARRSRGASDDSTGEEERAQWQREMWGDLPEIFAGAAGIENAHRNALAAARIVTREQIAGMTDAELLAIRNFGRKGLAFVRSRVPRRPPLDVSKTID
jgi:hypothetical protein